MAIIERPYLHQHPLTLWEIEGEGDQHPCPVCEEWDCFDGYSCSECKFHPETCGACDGKPSGSFYFCKLCWPQSPYFHKSCAQLPQQIQIPLRPLCILQVVEAEYTTISSLPFPCDFCNQAHTGPKFCNFQIGSQCASILIKYQEGRQHFQHFTHRHRLTLLETEVEDMKCQMCIKDIHGESYCCAPCKFYIHKSCCELPQQVQHSFHPPHSLTLQQNTHLNRYLCDACRFYIDIGMRYRCRHCDFDLHPHCLSLKPNIKYEDHQHLLILVENMSHLSLCHACRRNVEGTFFVRCVQCRLDFHVQCGTPASLPPSIVYQHHGHPLILITETLIKDDSVLLYCNVCKEEIKPNHPSYRCCADCQYNAHVRCVITEIQPDETQKGNHFSHKHFLFLLESERNDDIKCYACRKLIQVLPAYGCVVCKFYLHKSCFELPKVIFHTSHTHYLTLQDFSNSEEGMCKACGTNLDGLIYCCEMCGFNLDLDCASQHPLIKWKASSDECKYHEDREGIGHYSHYHPLTLLEVGDKKCKLCYKNIHGPSYGCAPCMFYIHKSCGELPQEVQHHSFHPRHSLTLQKNTSLKRFRCDACRLYVNPGIRYRCEDCDFDLHLECVSLKPNIKYEDHQHLLILVENMSYNSQCQTCGYDIEGTFFVRCVQCRLDFHVLCGTPASLPPSIVYQHHGHPLILTTETLIKDDSVLLYCNACKEEIKPNHPSYRCADCQYNAHVRCVITEIQLDERENVKHFSHNCFLFLIESNRNDDIKCNVCEKLIQAHPAYGCDQCRFYLHKSCAELPRQIQHLFHRHPLILKSHPDQGTKYHHCGSCNRNLRGFIYQCDNCFVIDMDCASLPLGVKYEGDEYILTLGDEHFLSLFEKLRHTPDCREYIYANTGALNQSCVKCNFIVYLFRSPLPQIIECGSHPHSLTLMDNLDNDNYGTQICDVCEEERDPQLCAYYCAECDFIAEFFCVISEVMVALQKKPREVLFRSISGNTTVKVNSKSLNLKDIYSFTDEEQQKLREILQAPLTDEEEQKLREMVQDFEEVKEEEERKKWKQKFNEVLLGLQGRTQKKETVYYLVEDFFQPLVLLFNKSSVSLLNDDLKCGVLDVGDYKTIPSLAGVLTNLLGQHGNIGATCTLAQRLSKLKTCLMFNICATVHSMCNTMIMDVNDSLIYTWWRHFNLARRTGFEVGFFFDHLKTIALARQEIDAELPQISNIHDRYEEMRKLSKEIDGHAKEIDERKGKIYLLRKHTQDEISKISYQNLRLEAERLTNAEELMMMKAGTGLALL